MSNPNKSKEPQDLRGIGSQFSEGNPPRPPPSQIDRDAPLAREPNLEPDSPFLRLGQQLTLAPQQEPDTTVRDMIFANWPTPPTYTQPPPPPPRRSTIDADPRAPRSYRHPEVPTSAPIDMPTRVRQQGSSASTTLVGSTTTGQTGRAGSMAGETNKQQSDEGR